MRDEKTISHAIDFKQNKDNKCYRVCRCISVLSEIKKMKMILLNCSFIFISVKMRSTGNRADSFASGSFKISCEKISVQRE